MLCSSASNMYFLLWVRNGNQGWHKYLLCVQLVFVSVLLCWHTYLFIYLDVCNSFHFHFTWTVKTTISAVLGNNFVILSNNNFDIILNGLLHHNFILLIMQSVSVKKKETNQLRCIKKYMQLRHLFYPYNRNLYDFITIFWNS